MPFFIKAIFGFLRMDMASTNGTVLPFGTLRNKTLPQELLRINSMEYIKYMMRYGWERIMEVSLNSL